MAKRWASAAGTEMAIFDFISTCPCVHGFRGHRNENRLREREIVGIEAQARVRPEIRMDDALAVQAKSELAVESDHVMLAGDKGRAYAVRAAELECGTNHFE